MAWAILFQAFGLNGGFPLTLPSPTLRLSSGQARPAVAHLDVAVCRCFSPIPVVLCVLCVEGCAVCRRLSPVSAFLCPSASPGGRVRRGGRSPWQGYGPCRGPLAARPPVHYPKRGALVDKPPVPPILSEALSRPAQAVRPSVQAEGLGQQSPGQRPGFRRARLGPSPEGAQQMSPFVTPLQGFKTKNKNGMVAGAADPGRWPGLYYFRPSA